MVFGREWSCYCKTDLTEGHYEISIRVQCAFIDESKLLGVNRDNLAPDQWPQALKQWNVQLVAPLCVEVKE